MSEVTKETALRILKSRVKSFDSGKYQVKVTSVNPFEDKHIVNVNAMNRYQAEAAKTHLADGKYQEAINQNLSFNVLATSERMPVRGEEIYIVTNNVKLKSGETALLVSSWSSLPVSQGQSFDFENAKVKELKDQEFPS
jgi:hypothetical protein